MSEPIKILLHKRGAEVEYYDPHVPTIGPTREHMQWNGKRSIEWQQETLHTFDAAVIATAHKGVNYAELVSTIPSIVDTRNVYKRGESLASRVWKG